MAGIMITPVSTNEETEPQIKVLLTVTKLTGSKSSSIVQSITAATVQIRYETQRGLISMFQMRDISS